MKRLVLVVLAAILLMAGCNSGSTGKPTFDELVYDLTGGIAGFDQHLAISGDGAFQIAEQGKSGKSGKLSAAELKTVRDLVGALNWESIKEKYVDPKVADAMFEGLRVSIKDTTHKTLVGTAGAAPAELTELLAKLRQILTDHR